MKLYPYVIVIQNNLIETTTKCKNGEHAKKVFLDKCCAEFISNWDEYNEDDRDVILNQNYEKSNNKSISIIWL